MHVPCVVANVAFIGAVLLGANYFFLSSTQSNTKKPTQQSNAEKPMRLLCWIETCDKNIHRKARSTRVTWASRCDKALYFSKSSVDGWDEVVGLGIPDGYKELPQKTFKALEYLASHHLQDYDWFLKADDDTYVVVENLKYFLEGKNPEDPLWAGMQFTPDFVRAGFFGGGGGYVISRGGLRNLVPTLNATQILKGAEDVFVARAAHASGLQQLDSRDAIGRNRFLAMMPDDFILRRLHTWFFSNIGSPHMIPTLRYEPSCLPISFHYITMPRKYMLEYVLYYMRVHGKQEPPAVMNVSPAEAVRKSITSRKVQQYLRKVGYRMKQVELEHPSVVHGTKLEDLLNVTVPLKSNREQGAPVLLCSVLTTSARFRTHAVPEAATWGSRCDLLVVFVEGSLDATSASSKWLTKEGINHHLVPLELKGETRLHAAVRHIAAKFGEAADWFLWSGDRAYVVVDNLRKVLSDAENSQDEQSKGTGGEGLYVGAVEADDDPSEMFVAMNQHAVMQIGEKTNNNPKLQKTNNDPKIQKTNNNPKLQKTNNNPKLQKTNNNPKRLHDVVGEMGIKHVEVGGDLLRQRINIPDLSGGLTEAHIKPLGFDEAKGVLPTKADVFSMLAEFPVSFLLPGKGDLRDAFIYEYYVSTAHVHGGSEHEELRPCHELSTLAV